MSNSNKTNTLLLILGITFGSVFLLCCGIPTLLTVIGSLIPSNDPIRPNQNNNQSIDSNHSITYRYVNTDSRLYLNEEEFKALMKFASDEDRDNYMILASGAEQAAMSVGTRIEIIETNIWESWYKAKVLTGEHKGKIGFIPMQFVSSGSE